MKKLLIICSILICSILSYSQTQTIQITGPSQTSGPVTLTVQINAPASCSVTITPTTLSIQTNATQQFTNTSSGCSPSTVVWKVNNVTGGDATHGTITTGGLYTAPASVPSPATVTVSVVSNDPSAATANASVTITSPPPPCSVSISPTTANVQTSTTQQFTATTQSCTPSTVSWVVNNIAGGNSTIGTVSNTGLYTAPASVPSPNVVTVSAISNQDGVTHSDASVTITAPPPTCTVSITPLLATVTINTTLQFTGASQNCSPSTIHWQVNGITGGNVTIGTISTTGLYTAPSSVPSPSTVTVTVVSDQSGSITASSSVTITSTAISTNDKYCSQGNVVVNLGTTDSFANLPTTCFYTNPSIASPTGTVRNATASNWSTVWASTNCGDIVEITAGTTIVGSMTIPTKTCDAQHYIWLRTSGYLSLPPYGTKISPCYAGVSSMAGRPNFNCGSTTNVMATIQSTGTSASLTLSTNTTYMRITGIVFARTGGTGEVATMVPISAGGINHIIMDHNWCQGTTNDETNNCTNFNRTSYSAFVDGFISDMHCISVTGACTDSKTIGGGTNNNATDTDNTWKIVNNYLESAAECIIFGGGAAAITPTDLEIRRNWCFKPLTWNPSDPSYNGGVGGHAYVVKNCIEFKNAQRLLVEGNVCENVWGGFSQVGEAFTLTPKNQSNVCSICLLESETLRYNYAPTNYQPLQVANVPSDAGGMALGGYDYSIHDNVFDNVRYSTCFQCSGSLLSLTESLSVPSNFVLHKVDINHNTIVLAGTAQLGPAGQVAPLIGTGGPLISSGLNLANINYTNNLVAAVGGTNNASGSSSCGFNQSNPVNIILACWSPLSFGGNTFVHNNSLNWTGLGTNCTSETDYTSALVNYNNGLNGDYHLKATSVCHNTATDGKDPGADITTANGYWQGVNTF